MAKEIQITAATQDLEEENSLSDSRALARNKWGHAMNSGFQIIPNVLFRCQKILGLDALDVVILLNITTHWWEPGDLPHPRPSVIAHRMGVDTRTVERHIKELQKKGLLVRQKAITKKGRKVRPYDLSGLVKALQRVSVVNLQRRDNTATIYHPKPDDAPMTVS